MNITKEPSVVTVGVFHGGVRHNIIPDEVKLEGTIRTFDEEQRDEIHEHVKRIAEMIAAAGRRHGEGAHPALVRRDRERSRRSPSGRCRRSARIAGEDNVRRGGQGLRRRGLLVLPEGRAGLLLLPSAARRAIATRATAAPNHSPRFYVDEECLQARREDALARSRSTGSRREAGREAALNRRAAARDVEWDPKRRFDSSACGRSTNAAKAIGPKTRSLRADGFFAWTPAFAGVTNGPTDLDTPRPPRRAPRCARSSASSCSTAPWAR